MKKILILSTVTAISLFATNGANLIGLGAESRALGGTGIAMYQGSENAMTNPALLGKTEGGKKELTIAATIFKADVSVTTTGSDATTRKSDMGTSVIPYIAHAHRITDDITLGFGLYGTGGMGVDYTGYNDDPTTGQFGLFNMKSELQIMQLAPTIAYNKDNYGLGLTAIIQYGKLSIDFTDFGGNDIGDGKMSSDTGFGLQIGGFYNISNNITLAGVFKSAIDMEYGDEISKASIAFGYGQGNQNFEVKSDHLEQPAEFGIGISATNENITYTLDYKTIKWGSAKGYKDFGWEDQKVFALGLKYQLKESWIGLGYNKSNNPIPNNIDSTSVAGGANQNGHTMNTFNYVLFPGTITKAYTFGGGLNIDKDSSIELAYNIMPEVSDTISGATVQLGNITTIHKQQALTVAYKFNF